MKRLTLCALSLCALVFVAVKKIGHIAIPEPWTANICFGGKDKKLLFMTAFTAIYTMPMYVKGGGVSSGDGD